MEKAKKPFIIPVFIPQSGCRHQCVFCNQFAVTGETRPYPSKKEIRARINEFLSFKNPRHRGETQIAFFGGNFMGMPEQHIRLCLETAEDFVKKGKVESIRFSTRPDTVSESRLSVIAPYSVSTIEIGAQSMDEEVLERSNRGHSAGETQTASRLLKEHRYHTGIQIMVGLPGDTEDKATSTTQKIIALTPDFVRIYPTLVLANSPLAALYENGGYNPLGLESCVSLVKKMVQLFRKNHIPVIRMGLQPTGELQNKGALLAGPYHPSFGHLVYSEIFLDDITEFLTARQTAPDNLLIRVHPKNISAVRGLNNHNIAVLNRKYGIANVTVLGDAALAPDDLVVDG